MTCIVGVAEGGKVWIGGDSAGVDSGNYSLTVRADRKVFRNGHFSLYATPDVEPAERVLLALRAAESFSAGVRAPFHVEMLTPSAAGALEAAE